LLFHHIASNMTKFTLLILPVLALFAACKEGPASKKQSDAPFDLNAALEKHQGDTINFRLHSDIDSMVNVVVQNQSVAATLATNADGIPCMVLARTKPGEAEIHEQVDDIAIIRSGHGTLKTGFGVTGNVRTTGDAPSRNWFCGGISNATDRALSPGDVILIPAMTAHQYIPNAGDTLSYWTIKVKHSSTAEKK